MGLLKSVKKSAKKIVKKAAPVLGAIGGTLVPGLGTVAGGALGGALGGAISGNGLKGVAGGALGGFGIGGGAALLGSGLSNAAGLGLSGGASGALGGSLLGAGSGALFGGGSGALLGGALGGAGGYIQGSGGLGNAYNNIKSDLGLQGQGVGTLGSGTSTSAAGSVGGGSTSYDDISSVYNNQPTSNAFLSPTGISSSVGVNPAVTGTFTNSPNIVANAASAAVEPSLFDKVLSKGNVISPLISGGLSTYSNQAAADSLLEQQEKNLAAIQPYLNQSFNPGDLENDPGYQFQLSQGTKAIDRAASARGNYFSGEALSDAAKFGQGLADSTYNDAYSRWLQGRNSNISALLNANGYNDAIGNVNANAIVNTSNGLAGAGAQLLGQNGIGNNGQSLNPYAGVLGGNNISSILAGMTPEQRAQLKAQLG